MTTSAKKSETSVPPTSGQAEEFGSWLGRRFTFEEYRAIPPLALEVQRRIHHTRPTWTGSGSLVMTPDYGTAGDHHDERPLLDPFTHHDLDLSGMVEGLDGRDERRVGALLSRFDRDHETRHTEGRHPHCGECFGVLAEVYLRTWLALNPGRTPLDGEPCAVNAGGRGRIDWGDLMTEEDAGPAWLAGRLVEEGNLVALVGAGKVGKSLFCLDWAAAIASGRGFLGDEPRKPVTVLYVDQENTERDLRRRAIALDLDPFALDALHYLSFPGFAMLDTAEGGAALVAEVERTGARVVFLDTYSRMFAGDENDAKTMLAVYRHTLMPLKALGVAVIRLDHTGKEANLGARGSSAKTQDVDHVWELRAGNGPNRLRLLRTFTRGGLGDSDIAVQRLGKPGEVGTTEHVREAQGAGAEVVASFGEVRLAVYDWFRNDAGRLGDVTAKQVEAGSRQSRAGVYRALPKLVEDGRLVIVSEKGKTKRYSLNPDIDHDAHPVPAISLLPEG